MPELQTYEGKCHCGKVRTEVKANLDKVMACNCSICSVRAHLLTFVTAENFRQLAGEDAMTDYQFNKHNIHHLFCATCGVASFGWGIGKGGEKMYSVNVRCLLGVDVSKLEVTHVDGKHF